MFLHRLLVVGKHKPCSIQDVETHALYDFYDRRLGRLNWETLNWKVYAINFKKVTNIQTLTIITLRDRHV